MKFTRADYPWGVYPHANEVLRPITDFVINGRVLSLYDVAGRTPSTRFSLYWNDETNPVQHAMTELEVFHALHEILERFHVQV